MICKTCGNEFDGKGQCPVCGSEAGEEFGADLENNDFFEAETPTTQTQQGASVGRARFCTHCGHKVHEDAVVCVHCGCAIEGATSSTQTGEKSKINGMAIAGFVCSFFIPILGWVFGGIGLAKSKKLDGKGKGFAIAAIAIASAMFVIRLINTINQQTYYDDYYYEYYSTFIER